jgi:hypothetical protein
MKEIIVFRLENNRGYGPWDNYCGCYIDYNDSYGSGAKHPNPHNDGIYDWYEVFDKSYFCAVTSIKEFRHWFNSKVRKTIIERNKDHTIDEEYRGWRVNIYKISDYKMGDHQVIFKKETAIKLKSYSLGSLSKAKAYEKTK